MTALEPRNTHAYARQAAMRAMRPVASLAGTKRTFTRWADRALRIEALAPRGVRNEKREMDSMDEVD